VVSAVPLSGGLTEGAELACDRGPGHTGFASRGNRLGNAAFGGGALGHCFADGVQWRSVADICRLVLLEPTLPFVGMFEDLLQAARHGHHLKYILRAVIAWTMTGPWSVSRTPSYESSGPRWPDDHHESLVEVLVANGMVERAEDVFVGDAVLACAVDDQRLLPSPATGTRPSLPSAWRYAMDALLVRYARWGPTKESLCF